ncbi:MAG TPA: hypothetical protein VNU97_06430 [Rhizomicrobium sp.]|jgi:hypothetical protein|nr:hypothetical protein [Rhizomicrobium sp.]
MDPQPPNFPPLVNWRGYGVYGAAAMILGAVVAIWLFAGAELFRLRHGFGSSPVATGAIAVAVVVILLAAYAAGEHRHARGERNAYEARASAAWYALLVPASLLLVASAIWEFPIPYPSPDQAISGKVLFFSVESPTSRGMILSIAVRGGAQTYRYECSYGRRTGWCAAYAAIRRAAVLPPPREATLIPLGRDLAMLRADGQTIVDWAVERRRRLTLALVMFLFGSVGLATGIWGTTVYAAWSRELARQQSPSAA